MPWLAPHLFAPPLLLGIDIDNHALRLVELSQLAQQRFCLERCACQPLPAGVVIDGLIQYPTQVAAHLTTLLQHSGTRRKKIALALPAATVMMRQVTVPSDTKEAALQALMRAEASRYLDIAPEQVSLDYQIGALNHAQPPQLTIALAAVRSEQVEDRIASAEAAGLKALVLDIDLCAAYAACKQQIVDNTHNTHNGLLLIGSTLSQIAIFDRQQLLFKRELIDCDATADTQKIAQAAAHALRLGNPEPSMLAHVFIGGACAAHDGLASALQQHSGIASTQVNPFADMQQRADAAPPDAAAYLVACGLAMRRVH